MRGEGKDGLGERDEGSGGTREVNEGGGGVENATCGIRSDAIEHRRRERRVISSGSHRGGVV